MSSFQKHIALFALLFLAGGAMGFAPRPTSFSPATSPLCASAPLREKIIVVIATDPNGRTTCRADESGNRTTYVQDPYNQVTQISLPDGATQQFDYFATGEPRQVSGGHDIPQTYEWLGTGELTALNTFRNWNSTNGFAGVSDKVRWEYNLLRGWPETKVYADNTRHTFVHAPNGWVTSYTSARLISAAYGRDAAGQLRTKRYTDSTPGVTNTWNQRDLVIAVQDASGLRTNVFDAGSRLLSTTVNGPASHALTIVYCTNSDQRATTALMVGSSTSLTTTCSFGTNGLVTAITAQCPTLGATNLTFTYSWLTNATLISTITLPNGVTNQFCYQTNADRVAAIRVWPYFATPPIGSTAAPVLEYDYSYNSAGNCTNLSRPYESRRDQYAYDNIGHLVLDTREIVGIWTTNQWLFDTVGNRVAEANGLTGATTVRSFNNL